MSFLSPKELISFIDLTSLNETDTEENIAALCRKAVTPVGAVAAVCVYPRFAKFVADKLKGSGIKVATVANFPQGRSPLGLVLAEIKQSLQDGAEEIDLVFPYEVFMRGDKEAVSLFVSECKDECADASLKVIIETGALKDLSQIAEAAELVIRAGADFIKTSTGKLNPGATLEAASVMLETIKKLSPSLKRPLGFKAAGGVREPEQAQQYYDLAQDILGSTWPSPANFRIGASQLVDKLSTH